MKLFNTEEEERLTHAINVAENRTSGEIRLCVEKKCAGDVIEQATKRFNQLDMHKTALKNGILFFLALDDHKFAIIGDAGIDQKVPENFWQETKDLMINYFKKDLYVDGLVAGIDRAGKQLKTFFPRSDDDINELPDDIAYF